MTAVIAFTTGAQSKEWPVAADAGFILACASSCFAFLALFVRFAQSRSKVFDTLTENSYGIYLVHYAFVSWLQYWLVLLSLPAIAKALIVFSGALFPSWGTAATLRRIPVVASVI